MSVLFDTSILLHAIYPNARASADPATGKPVELAKERVDYLIRSLSDKRSRIIVPSPVLAELLVGAGDATNEYVQILQKTPFRISPFDTRAAIECAESLGRYGMKGKGQGNSRAKVKFDRQIVAIAQVERVDAIYSDDTHIFDYGAKAGIKVVRLWEMDIDPEDRQHKLSLICDQDGDCS